MRNQFISELAQADELYHILEAQFHEMEKDMHRAQASLLTLSPGTLDFSLLAEGIRLDRERAGNKLQPYN